ncbi:MAG: ribose 5-phosphate isomerase A [Phycisphaeraceae bacterium]|nr:ribose 5-phosphate isomerase A [Phycisphaerales bacterium]MCB9861026.1 ribose 5-phosphate isomerase A [Phycisphaeraceae bacterium]
MSNDTPNASSDLLAQRVIAEIETGMIVGMGTGSAAERGMHELARRVRQDKLKVACVPSSDRTEKLATELGLPLVDFSKVERINYFFGGAYEVDTQLRLLKGAGGAITRERMLCWASDRNVFMLDQSRVVERLGSSTILAVAVMAFGLASIRAELRNFGLNGVIRRTLDGKVFITDNANLILDVTLEEQDLDSLATLLNSIPGVVDHGLFMTEANDVFVEMDTGDVEHLVRCEDEPASESAEVNA